MVVAAAAERVVEVAMAGEDGFLSRWARRKADAREGKPLDEPVPPKPLLASTAVASPSTGVMPLAQGDRPPSQAANTAGAAPLRTLQTQSPSTQQVPVTPEPPPLTLQDAQALTAHSDFKPFMSQQVQPEVRNAAMKKLFAHPHYNVMDGLDTYIDEYTKSDPIPESMLRQMVGAQFLKLFDDDTVAPAAPVASVQPLPPAADPRESPDDLPTASVAQSTDSNEPSPAPDHAHTHLRLQPDHAPAGPDTGSRPA